MARTPPRTQSDGDVTVVGAPPQTLRDFYHLFLRAPWWMALSAIVAAWLGINAVFGAVYFVVGGVTGARARSFWDAFIFSVQTMGTIGYGSMYPTSVAANVCMTLESVVSLIVTALATGLVFAKFSRSTARVVFARHAVIGPMDGVPTLMMRVGNERGNSILEATIRLVMMPHRAAEGGHHLLPDDRPQADARAVAGDVALVDGPAPHHARQPPLRRHARVPRERRGRARRHPGGDRRHVAAARARSKPLPRSRHRLGRAPRRRAERGGRMAGSPSTSASSTS